MNRTANKCDHCKKAYQRVKDGQKYCSLRCRQTAYRQRKASPRRAKTAIERDLSAATCEHCGGSFLTATSRGRFCSTSCRSLYHRAMRAAIPAALVEAYNLPGNTALDLLEGQPLERLRARLTERGYIYDHQRRAWVQRLEIEVRA